MARAALDGLLLGDSKEMVAVRENVAAAIETDEPLLVEGERGTGREHVARAMHLASHRDGGFVKLDPSTGGRSLGELDEELTQARGGTLLVKDIALAGHAPQRKLLKVVRARSSRTVETASDRDGRDGKDVRLIGATAVDLESAVADELFDKELYERLGHLKVRLPPLRKRPADVPSLAQHFVREAGARGGRKLELSSRACDRLAAYPWPGNVAELKDVMARLALRAKRVRLDVPDVEAELPTIADKVPLEELSFEEMVRAKIRVLLQQLSGHDMKDLYDEVISRVERPLFQLVLEETRGNQVRAAEMLGLNRNTLRKKIAERGVEQQPAPAKRRSRH